MARKRAEDAAVPKMDRAKAAYTALDYTEAERLALEACADARKAVPLDKVKLIQALELAGWSASRRRDDKAALAHFTDASKLTDITLLIRLFDTVRKTSLRKAGKREFTGQIAPFCA